MYPASNSQLFQFEHSLECVVSDRGQSLAEDIVSHIRQVIESETDRPLLLLIKIGIDSRPFSVRRGSSRSTSSEGSDISSSSSLLHRGFWQFFLARLKQKII